MGTTTVRALRFWDIIPIQKIERESFESEWTPLDYATKTHGGLAAEDAQGRTAGVIWWRYLPRPWNAVEIVSLGVLRRARRDGTGRALVERLQADYPALRLFVLAGNTRAISFYERLGFKRQRATIRKGRRGFLMTWERGQ